MFVLNGCGCCRLSFQLNRILNKTTCLYTRPTRRVFNTNPRQYYFLKPYQTIYTGGISSPRRNGFDKFFGYCRRFSNKNDAQNRKLQTTLLYLLSAAVASVGLSYAAVPLYRIYCQATGYAGTTKKVLDIGDKIVQMERVPERKLIIRFEAATSATLQWKFKPQQTEIELAPGETALAFYTALNMTDRPIIGISTYNVVPFDAGQYFNKIQCFCFEEQQLNPHEEVDMPVFFYIDPDFDEDPKMAKVDEIILSYTFFESSGDQVVPINISNRQ